MRRWRAEPCPVSFHPVEVRGSGRMTLVDADLYARVIAEGPWYAHKARKCVYVRSWKIGHRRVYLHELVQRLRRRRRPSGDHVVRHLSGDTFDNTDGNLRWGTRSKNVRDRPYRGGGDEQEREEAPTGAG